MASFSFGELSLLSVTVYEDVVEGVLAEQEQAAIDAVLQSNDSQVVIDAGGMLTTATIVSADNFVEDVTIEVEVSNGVSIGIPRQVLGDLVEEEVLLVVVELSDTLSSKYEYEETDEAGRTEFLVEGTVGINLYTLDGVKLEVSNLTDPLQLRFAVPPTVVAPHLLKCAVWDALMSEWSFDGIEQGGLENGTLTCTTSHLSLFGMVARGFVESFECSQTSLLTTRAIRQLWKRDWGCKPTVVVLWVVITGFTLLLIAAVIMDLYRIRQGRYWMDARFFLFEREDGHSDEDAEDKTWCGLDAKSVAEVGIIAWRTVRDEGLAAVVVYLDALRAACEGLRTVIWNTFGAVKDEDKESAGEKDHDAEHEDRVRVWLEAMTREMLKWAVHLNACSRAFVHYNDNYTEAVDSIAAQDSGRRVSSESHRHSPSAASEAETTYISNLADAEASVPVTPSASASLPLPLTMQSTRSGSYFQSSIDGLQLQQSMSGELADAQHVSLADLHVDYSQRLDSEYRDMHSLRHYARSIGRQLLVHGPVGRVFAYSIYKSCSLRALEFLCLALGDLVVATLFMSLSGKTRSASNTKSCKAEDLGFMAGRFIAMGIAGSFIALIPVLVIFNMHIRKFHTVPYRGCKEMRLRLRAWWFLDVLLWILALAYSGLCTLYVMLFFANVTPVDHNAWLLTATTSLSLDLIVTPLGSSFFVFLCLAVCVLALALWTGSSRREVVAQLRTTGDDSEGLSVRSSNRGAEFAKKVAHALSTEEDADHGDARSPSSVVAKEGKHESPTKYKLSCSPSGIDVVLDLPEVTAAQASDADFDVEAGPGEDGAAEMVVVDLDL